MSTPFRQDCGSCSRPTLIERRSFSNGGAVPSHGPACQAPRRNRLRNPALAAYLCPMNTLTAAAPTAGNPAPDTARSASLIEVRLAEIETVARDTNVYTFRRPDGAALPGYQPGA